MPVPKKLKEEMHPGSEQNGNAATTFNDDETSTTTTTNNVNVTNGVGGISSSVRTLPSKLNNKIGFRKKYTSAYDMKQGVGDPFRFAGEGIDFKSKFIGEQDVLEARGDQMCQNAMQACKASVKLRGEHKQRIWFNITLKGFKIKDQITGVVLFNFPVNKVSFIAKDVTDNRAFGFVYGGPDEKHKFFAIKTEKSAKPVVFAIRDMFQIVYEIKKKQIEEAKQHHNNIYKQPQPTSLQHQTSAMTTPQTQQDGDPDCCSEDVAGVPVANLLDLELELENLEQEMKTMNDWAAFSGEDNGNNTENNMMVHSVSAPGGYQDSLWSEIDQSTANSRQLHSDSFNNETTFDPIQSVPRPTFHLNKTNGNTIISPIPPPIVHSSRRSHPSHASTPLISNGDLFNGSFQSTSSNVFQPPSSVVFANDSFSVPATNSTSTTNGQLLHDPFDTSHVNQVLSDKITSGEIQEPPSFMNISDATISQTTAPVAMGFVNEPIPSFDLLIPNNVAPQSQDIFNESTSFGNISSQQSSITSPTNNYDQALEKLCNLETLSNPSTQKLQTIGVIPTTTPFANMKQSSKKSLNELRGESDGSGLFAQPLLVSQKSNVPVMPMDLTKSSTTPTSNNAGIFFDENLMQTTPNINNAMPPIPPRSTQSTSVLPRPEVNQRSSKGLLPPPVSSTSHRQSTETKGGDPFADDFFM